MKRIFPMLPTLCRLLALCLLLTLTACGTEPEEEAEPNTYYDENTGLLLTYPADFSATGTLTENGRMDFYTLWDTGFQYWTEPNEEGLTPDALVADMTEWATLDGNVVIAYGDGTDPNGQTVPTAYYWVVDMDFIAHVEIYCSEPEEVTHWYDRLQNHAFYIENAGGTIAAG